MFKFNENNRDNKEITTNKYTPTKITQEIISFLDCPCKVFPPNTLTKELYLSILKNENFIDTFPVLILSDDTLEEALELSVEDSGEDDIIQYRKKLLNNIKYNGSKILSDRYQEYKEYMNINEKVDFDYIIEKSDFVPGVDWFLSFNGNNEEEVILAYIPAKHPWEVIAWIPFGGWNECPMPEDMISVLQYWHEKYGAIPSLISRDVLEISVPEPITDAEEAFKLAKEQYAFCNDIVDQGVGSLEELAVALMNSTVWYFWWD